MSRREKRTDRVIVALSVLFSRLALYVGEKEKEQEKDPVNDCQLITEYRLLYEQGLGDIMKR